MTSSDTRPMRVAVVGGGLVGPLVALLIQREAGDRVEVSLLERDSAPWSRDQGTAIDLGGGAMRELSRAGVRDAVRKASRSGSDVTRVVSAAGDDLLLLEMPRFLSKLTPPAEEVNRNELRALLLAELKTGTVHFGCQVTAISVKSFVSGERRVQLDIGRADASIESQWYDAVIGADGSTSCLRSWLFDDEGHEAFTGFACAQGFVLDPVRDCPLAHEMLGKGSLMALGGGQVIWAQRYASDPNDHRICFYVSVPSATPPALADTVAAVGGSGDDAVHRWTAACLPSPDWHPALQQLAAAADWYVLRNFYQWPARPRAASGSEGLPLVLCGDALHAMLPFQGAGANVGLQDAGDVASAIVRASKIDDEVKREEALVAGLRSAEKVMLRRSAEEAVESWAATVFFHSADVVKNFDSRFFGGRAAAVLCAMRRAEVRCGSDWLWPATLVVIAAIVYLRQYR